MRPRTVRREYEKKMERASLLKNGGKKYQKRFYSEKHFIRNVNNTHCIICTGSHGLFHRETDLPAPGLERYFLKKITPPKKIIRDAVDPNGFKQYDSESCCFPLLLHVNRSGFGLVIIKSMKMI